MNAPFISGAAPVAKQWGKSPRLATLDFLRGLAILGVVAIHTTQHFPSHIKPLDFAFANGWIGVQVFFFVSAYTMCHMWSRRAGEAHPVRKFYIRRFLRIAPPFWAAMVVYLLIEGLQPQFFAPYGLGATQIGLTALYLHGLWPDAINSVVPGGWSIAVEMTFYSVFPLLILAFGANRFAYLKLAVAVYLANVLFLKSAATNTFLSGAFAGHPELVEFFLHNYFPVQAPIFLVGCFLYFSLGKQLDWMTYATLALWIALAALADHFHPVREFHYLIIYLGLGAAVYAALRLRLGAAPVESLGRNSYAMYLTHFLVLQLLAYLSPIHEGAAATLAGFAATVLLSYAAARGSYYLIERPSQRLASRLTQVEPSVEVATSTASCDITKFKTTVPILDNSS